MSEVGPVDGPGRHRLHLLTPLFDLVTTARSLWPALIVLLGPRTSAAGAILVGGIAVAMTTKVVGWLFTTYELGDDALVHRAGMVRREERTMPYDRVQHVTVAQKLRHRLFRVGRLEVAAASGEKIVLDVLSVGAARRLQEAIERRRGPGSAGSRPPDAAGGALSSAAGPVADSGRPTPLVRLSIAELALAGVTGARLLVVLGAGFTLLNTIDELPINVWDRVEGSDIPAATTASVAAAVLVLSGLWFGLAALASVVTDFGFTIVSDGDRFMVTRGLLARSEVTVPAHRIQTVLLHQSLLRRWMQRTMIRVHSAAGRFAVPLLPFARAVDLLDPLIGCRSFPPLRPAPLMARRRAITRRTAPAAVGAAVLTAAWPPWGAVSLLAVPAAAVAGWAAYRGLAHGFDDVVLVARRGALYRTFVIVPAHKAQSTRVTRSFFQRRLGLATLHVDVAGGEAAKVPDVTPARANTLAEALVIPTRARTADDRRSRSGGPPRGPR